MSNNFMSEHLSVSSSQMGKLEPVSNNLNPTIQMGMMESVPNDSASQRVSNMPMGLLESFYNSGPNKLSISNKVTEHTQTKETNFNSHQFVMPQKYGEMGMMPNIMGSQQFSIPNKRKAPMEPLSGTRLTQQSSFPNKRVGQMENRPWLQQKSAPNKRDVHLQAMPDTSGSQNMMAPIRRTLQMEYNPTKSGPKQLSIPKNQHAHMHPSPKVQTESFESVRSKLRESLAAALALSSEQIDKKHSQSVSTSTPGQTHEKSQPVASISEASVECEVTLQSTEDNSDQKHIESQSPSQENVNKNTGDSTLVSKCDEKEFQSNIVLPDIDASFTDNFFVKDELLQGNGLTWVLDPFADLTEKKMIQTVEKEMFEHDDFGGHGQATESPQTLALKIESELFKLYGGVNKKYKEKGRSLLFNLKDRSNPELRERVISGDISPQRLCSMTAEELASKELSEWRIAKAEELAQMIVLPDSDVRRLVKKTHKGEVQVEVEQDDNSISVEVSVGRNTLSQNRSRSNRKEVRTASQSNEAKDKSSAGGEKSKLHDQDNPCTITIPSNDGTDLMQGLIVDDELKDTDLPPIVSLDEFMESLDSEPPFENLPVDAAKATPISEKGDSGGGSQQKSSNQTSKDPVDSTTDKSEKSNATNKSSDSDPKSSDSGVISKTAVPASKVDDVWEGLLQLNVTSMTSVVSFFKSGEKTSAKEWPSFLEIKGRVRLDAFEKFLQQLRISRSRAIMVLHFISKDGSPETERASIREVADSYVLDDRVGFAEPVPGVELYFCPPHTKTLEMLNKHLSIDQIEALNAIDNGLIGVVVWRKTQLTSTISPNSSSHHKHSSKKQHISTRRHQEKDTNMSPKFTPKSKGQGPPKPKSSLPEDDDDVPPGFGPSATRDEDDLPEFNFSGGSNSVVRQFPNQNLSRGLGLAPSSHSRPADQMRELIHKYGQSKTSDTRDWHEKSVGVAIQPWNDDDDDIPEWQPQVLPMQTSVQGFQQQMLRPHIINHQQPHQSMMPSQALHPATNMMQGSQNPSPSFQQGAWWVPPSASHGYPQPK